MTAISIRDPSLVVLIGAAGSGKSTFAARHFDPSEVLSSDGYRYLIAGDAADQTVSRAAFGRLHRDLARRLVNGQMTVVDATNIERAARLALLRRGSAAGVPAVAIVFDLPPELVIARNAERTERVVDPHIVRDHLDRLRITLDQPGSLVSNEDFSQIIVLRDPLEIDRLRIVRLID